MTKSGNDIQQQYDKIGSIYDILDAVPERFFYRYWRRRLWNEVTTGKVLEIGVGTGKNIGFYPPGVEVTAIDISLKMLEKATSRAASRPDISLELLNMDATALSFEAAQFDTVVGSFILMVVPEPQKVLHEVKRVCKPGGKLFLLEFTRSDNPMVSLLQSLAQPLNHALYRAHINRDITLLVERSGFRITGIEEVWDGIVKIIRAAPSE